MEAAGEGDAADTAPDVSFIIDLVKHALEYPIEHFTDVLEGAIGTALALGVKRAAAWMISKARLQFVLRAAESATNDAGPLPPDDVIAVKARRKHSGRLHNETAPAYIWSDGKWHVARIDLGNTESLPAPIRGHFYVCQGCDPPLL